MPNSVLEAMALELPVVSTNIGGVPELGSRAKPGFFARPAMRGHSPKRWAGCWRTRSYAVNLPGPRGGGLKSGLISPRACGQWKMFTAGLPAR